jgi:thiamine biosynthesis lipoprotein
MKIFITVGLSFFLLLVSGNVQSSSKSYARTQIVFGNVPFKIEITTTLTRKKAFRVMAEGFAIVRQIDATLSPYRKDSELSQLNSMPKPAYDVKLSPLLCETLREALRFTMLTENYFDVTFPMRRPNASALQIDKNCRADLLQKDLLVNPTGLVKGLTVDRLLKYFRKNKRIQSALVAASGDIGVFDRKKKSTYIALKNPTEDPTKTTKIKLMNQVVSTSGFYERGRHIKNTGEGKRHNHLQTSVIAKNGVTSDALSTALIFMPESKIKKILAKFKNVRAIVYHADGRVVEL